MRARALAPVGVVATAAPAISGLWALCAWEARRARGGDRPYTDALDGTARIGAGLDRRARCGSPGSATAWPPASAATTWPTPLPTSAARLLERPVDVTMLAVPGSKASDVIENQLDHVDPYTDARRAVRRRQRRGHLGVPRRRTPSRSTTSSPRWHPLPVVMLTLPDISMADRMAEPLRTPGRRPRPLLRGRPRQGRRPPRPRRVGRHRQPPAGPRAAAPAADCSAPTASTRAPRATGCGPSASPRACSDILEPQRSMVPPQPVRLTVRCVRRRRCR